MTKTFNHQVHHGANRYCLDKNYGAVLIIWDRMFGTFQAERSDVDIVYGLVEQPQFWNPLKHQVDNYRYFPLFLQETDFVRCTTLAKFGEKPCR